MTFSDKTFASENKIIKLQIKKNTETVIKSIF